MRLLIVESPNKIKKLRQYVGDGFILAASLGHVRDLPPRGGLAVDFLPDGTVKPYWETSERGAEVVARLRQQARSCDEVWLAMDPDREGEAIAWHLAAVLDLPCQRVTFRSITKKAVQDALGAPRTIDYDLVDAQQARRVLDRVVGWTVSPALKHGLADKRARSAGRVQSAALRLVVEREEAIQAHDTVKYHQLLADIVGLVDDVPSKPFRAECVRWKGAELGRRLTDAATAKATAAWCQRQPWEILSLTQNERRRAPPPPFTTSTVQQAASVTLKFDAGKTMQLLQQLFEAGLITYHRTDSTALAPEAIAMAREELIKRFGPDAVPKQGRQFGVHDPRAQEAHEAIRPVAIPGAKPPPGDPAKLYRLIGERFLASQMQDYREAVTTVRLACGPVDGWQPEQGQPEPLAIFQAVGRQELAAGWRALGRDATEEGKESKGQRLPRLTQSTPVQCQEVLAKLSKTKPPPRFTEASLIKMLERSGVGRPSTYTAIIELLKARSYVKVNKRRQLVAEELGMRMVDWLRRHFSGNFIDIDYTARMEAALDAVAAGDRGWQPLVGEARGSVVKLARQSGLGFDPTEPLPTAPPCPLCHAVMDTRTSVHGPFFVCPRRDCSALCDSSGKPNQATRRLLEQRQGGFGTRFKTGFKTSSGPQEGRAMDLPDEPD